MFVVNKPMIHSDDPTNSYKWDYNDICIYNLSCRSYNPIYNC